MARLAHPNIARLLDGGSTPEGVLYLVMEFIQGEQITNWCERHLLGVAGRLRLFLRVCEAVYLCAPSVFGSSRSEPGNILVTEGGVPKLLDFGVAKLLDPLAGAGPASTLYGPRPLTPGYASPEQVLGLTVTTDTDVYALGAILYELLTGERAQRIDNYAPAEIHRVVSETEPPRPRVMSPGLDSDLDNIVMAAMRKEPERRYPSVDQFAADIQRHLDGLPVMARHASFAYRARKFVRRNRFPIAAAALLFGTLIGGVAVSLHKASQAVAVRRLAEVQKQTALLERSRSEAETQTADRERLCPEAETRAAKAEEERSARRLTQMVELADRSLYGVHAAIEKLPGSTEARRQIVTTTLEFLKNLSRDAGNDDPLRLVLSAAYMKVADLQGRPTQANLEIPGEPWQTIKNPRCCCALCWLRNQTESNV